MVSRGSYRLGLGAALFTLWLASPAIAWADTCQERARAIALGRATMEGETDCDRAGVYAATATVSVAAVAVSVSAATLGISLASAGASGLGLGSVLPLPGGGTATPPASSPAGAAPSDSGEPRGGTVQPPPVSAGSGLPGGGAATPAHIAPPASAGSGPPGGGAATPTHIPSPPAKGAGPPSAPPTGAHEPAAPRAGAASRSTGPAAGEPSSTTKPIQEAMANLPTPEIRDAVMHLLSPGKVVGWKFHDIEHFREEYWTAKGLENAWEAHQTQDHIVFLFSSEFGIAESAARSLLELPKAMWEPVATVIASIAH